MGLFEHWPYTNFHDLNLDWIISKIKEIHTVKESADASAATATAAAASAQASAAEALKYAESIVHYDNYVLIGDSYGAGWTPDGDVTSWQTHVVNAIRRGNPDATIVTKSAGGYGFATATGFIDLLQSVEDSDAVGVIIVAGGYNDTPYTRTQIDNGIINFVDYAHEHFPNSRILIGACGWIVEGLTTGIHSSRTYTELIDVIEQYKLSAARNNIEYIKNIEYSLYKKAFFSSDYVHPNSDGNYQIAFAILGAIANSNQFISEYLTNIYDAFNPASNITPDAAGLGVKTTVLPNAGTVELIFGGYSIGVSGSPTIRCTGNYQDGILLGTFNNPAIVAAQSVSIPCEIVIASSTSPAYTHVSGSIILFQHNAYLAAFDINSTNNNYREISNINQIQVRFAKTVIPAMYN